MKMAKLFQATATNSNVARLRLPAALLGACASLLLAVPAQAGEKVGRASYVQNKVSGKIETQVVQINAGEDVFGREIVSTLSESLAKIVLKDDTNLAVGPNSSVTLDSFVYAGPSDFKKASFGLARGALRFTSGASDRRSYQVRTPNATIGVRG
jgi:hypothetical protein